MPARHRLSTAAVALTTVLTAGAAALLTGCGPENDPASAGPAVSGTATAAAPATGSPGSTGPAPAKPAEPAVNGTGKNGLTISNGTDHVLMNGTSVDFGTVVRDLAWSPDGSKAAFINGSGDLVTANPDGSGRVVVAGNPGGETWSHPTWQVAPAHPENGDVSAKNNLVFAAAKGGVSRLEGLVATSVNGRPEVLSLGTESGEGVAPLPTTGNTWPSGGGAYGTTTYANSDNGEVYIRDDYLRQQGGSLTNGSQPALSPAGDDLVFVRSVDGHDHIFEGGAGDRPIRDLTPAATTDFTEPAWSPDGLTIAARTPDGIYTLRVDGSDKPARVSTYTGLPAYRR
ncbi:hypothetical protein [Kitasatospora sp. NBC_00315]|uniref:hypothetical protein n=1 Tax=Kitasatospora sp. NBC_00315 TaxID=2975963 RepID=UPI00324ADA4D